MIIMNEIVIEIEIYQRKEKYYIYISYYIQSQTQQSIQQ